MLKFIIGIIPVTKKNSQQIWYKKTRSGKKVPFIAPSVRFNEYQEQCAIFIPNIKEPINATINIKAIYYRPDRRVIDLPNLNSALHDVLVHYKVIKDDRCTIVVSTDGSRVAYSKSNPRTEVEITESDYECWEVKKKTIDDILPVKEKKRLRKVYT